MIKKFFLLSFVVFIPIVLSACIPMLNTGESAEKKGEFAKGKMVKGFGGNVPLYKEAQVIETFANDSSYGGSFISDDNLQAVLKYYQEVLPQLGWESQVREVSQTNYVFDIKNGELRGEVIINVAGDGKKSAITIAVSQR